MIATSDQSRSSTTISFADSDALVIHPHWQNEVQLQRSSCQQQQATWRIRRPDGRCSSSTTRFRHPLKSHQNFDSFDFPRSGENGNRLRRRKMGITFVVVRLFPNDYCWSSYFLLLSTLYWLGLGSSNSSLLEGISENEIMYDVESSFSECVVSHLARILSCVLCIEDARFLCLCLGPAAGAALSVTVRYMEAARRKQIGTVEARCRLVIGEL